jgi:hypothetical protein
MSERTPLIAKPASPVDVVPLQPQSQQWVTPQQAPLDAPRASGPPSVATNHTEESGRPPSSFDSADFDRLDAADPEPSATFAETVAGPLAMIGSFSVHFLQWLLLCVGSSQHDVVGLAFLLLFIASCVMTTVQYTPSPYPTRHGAPVVVPTFAVHVATVAVAVLSLITTGTFLVIMAVGNTPSPQWRLAGLAPEDFASVQDVVLRILAQLVFLFLGITAVVFSRVDTTARVWPRWLTVSYAMWRSGSLLNAEWLAVICCCVTSSLRRCLCSVPCFVVFVALVAKTLHTRAKLRIAPVAATLGATYVVMMVVAYAVISVVETYNGGGPTSDALFLLTAHGDAIIRDTFYVFFLGVFLFVVTVARAAELFMPLRAREFVNPADEMEMPILAGAGHRQPLATAPRLIALAVFRTVRSPLDVAMIYLLLNMTWSCISIGWAVLWVVVLVAPLRHLHSAPIVWFGLAHLTGIFVGGFRAVARGVDRKYVGLAFHDVSEIVAAAAILAVVLTNVMWALFLDEADRARANGLAHQRVGDDEEEAEKTAIQQRFDAMVKWLKPARDFVRRNYVFAAFLALFLATVVHVRLTHAPFLLLFVVLLLWQRSGAVVWWIVLGYTSLITLALYAVNVALREGDETMTRMGFFTNQAATWQLWPYFLLTVVFAANVKIKAPEGEPVVRPWMRYGPVVERTLAGIMAFANVVLFLVIGSIHQASIIGLEYTVFFLLSATIIFATSLHSPPRYVRVTWTVITVLSLINNVLLYLYQLSPSTWEGPLTAMLPAGISLDTVGVTLFTEQRGATLFGMLPLITSVLLCVVQRRAWARAAEEAHTDDQLEVLTRMRQSVNYGLLLVPTCSLFVAATVITIASAVNQAFYRAQQRLTMLNAVYLFLAVLLAVSRTIRSAWPVWRMIQAVGCVIVAAIYLVQLPIFQFSAGPPSSATDTLLFFGLPLKHTTDPMWYLLSPHVYVFLAVVIHANAANHWGGGKKDDDAAQAPVAYDADDNAQPLTPAQPRTPNPPVAGESAEWGDITATADVPPPPPRRRMKSFWVRLMRSPLLAYSKIGFHVTLVSLFMNALVQGATVAGALYLLLGSATATMGRKRMLHGVRWLLLSSAVTLTALLQFTTIAAGPPNVFGIDAYPADLHWAYFHVGDSVGHYVLTLLSFGALWVYHAACVAMYGAHPVFGLPADGHMSTSDKLSAHQKQLAMARRHNAMRIIDRRLPLPLGRVDFTKQVRWLDTAKLRMYQATPLVVISISCVYCVYDASSRLILPKLVLLVANLAFLQLSDELVWRGNSWWSWMLRGHLLLEIIRAFYVSPLSPPDGDAFGLVPIAAWPADADSARWRHQTGDTAFHYFVLFCVWFQAACYERAEYAFFLHFKQREFSLAQRVGRDIRRSRRDAMRAHKAGEREYFEARQRLLANVINAADADAQQVQLAALAASVAVQQQSSTMASELTFDTSARQPLLVGLAAAAASPQVNDTDEGSDRNSAAPAEPELSVWASFKKFVADAVDSLIAWLREHSRGRDKAKPLAESQDVDLPKGLSAPTPPNDSLGGGGGNSGSDSDGSYRDVDNQSASYRDRTQRTRVWLLAAALTSFVFSHFERVCLLLFCLQFAYSPSVVNMLLPVSAMCYAVIMNPRPHFQYWTAAAAFLQLAIILKSLIKVFYCGDGLDRNDPHNKFSVWTGRTCVSNFYIYDMVFQLLCVVSVVIQKMQLVRWGLWNNDELHDASGVPMAAEAVDEAGQNAGDGLTAKATAASIVTNVVSSAMKKGNEYYKVSFSTELIAFLVLFFGYYKLAGESSSITNALQHSVLPGQLTIALIICFIIMVIDRVVYVRRSIVFKFATNCVFALGYHIVMLVWFMQLVEFNSSYYADDSFDVRGALGVAVVLYALKMLFLLFGAMQVSAGFVPYIRHISFAGTHSYPEQYVYLVSRLTPFVFELRVLLDWTVTPTMLKMNQWIQLEDMCHEIYSVGNDRLDTTYINESKKDIKRDPFPRWYKYAMGSCSFFIVALVLLFPLVVYSSLSPALEANGVTTITATLSIPGAPPLYKTSESIVVSDTKLNSTVTKLIERTRPSLVATGLTIDTVQMLQLTPYSNTLFAISPPAMHHIKEIMKNAADVEVSLDVTIRSSTSFAGTRDKVMTQMRKLTRPERLNLAQLLSGDIANLTLTKFYTPIVFNEAQQLSYFEQPAPFMNTIDCSLSATRAAETYFSLSCGSIFGASNPMGDGKWNKLTPHELRCLRANECPNYQLTGGGPMTDGLYFIVLSSAVLSVGLLQSVGIIAAYTTFVFAIGRVIRFAFSGATYRVSVENMEDPAFLVAVIEYLFMTRAESDFQAERAAYVQLTNIMRVTEVLERRTRYKEKTD